MISLVQHSEKPNVLLMRARARHHLVALAGKGKEHLIEHTPERDYAWRIEVAKASVAELLFVLAMSIDYGNFKDSVEEEPLHDMYSTWWAAGLRYQREDLQRQKVKARKGKRGENQLADLFNDFLGE
jgi:hypothetical protein